MASSLRNLDITSPNVNDSMLAVMANDLPNQINLTLADVSDGRVDAVRVKLGAGRDVLRVDVQSDDLNWIYINDFKSGIDRIDLRALLPDNNRIDRFLPANTPLTSVQPELGSPLTVMYAHGNDRFGFTEAVKYVSGSGASRTEWIEYKPYSVSLYFDSMPGETIRMPTANDFIF